MAAEINFDWSSSTKIDGEYYPEDMLGHQRYAEFLTRFLVSQGFDASRETEDQERSYVLNLNSAWGSGKSYFLRRWAENLEDYHPVVYVDAWKKDYSDDPLLTTISAIVHCLSEQAGDSAIREKLPRKMLGLLKAAAPGAVSAFGKRYFGIDPIALMTADDEGDIGKTIEDENGDDIDMGAAASSAVKYLIEEHEAKSEAVDSLKKSVRQWIKAVVALKPVSLPAFIFIDELDRCRPSYAVEMLETIKHIFNIPGVVFVVATDTEQLQHAVRAVYGEGFDARVYLSRFFNSRFSLKEPDLKQLLHVHCEFEKLSDVVLADKGIKTIPVSESGQEVLEDIAALVSIFKHTPRTAIQIADRVIATVSNLPENSRIDIFLLTFLLSLKERDHELYVKVIGGNFSHTEGEKDITIIEYLKKHYLTNLENKFLRIPLDPPSITPTLMKEGGISRRNTYPVTTYSISIDDYISHICFPNLGYKHGLNSIVYIDLGRRDGYEKSEPTALEKVSAQLMNFLKEGYGTSEKPMDSKVTVQWLKYIYIHEQFDSMSAKDYRDLVDLASALDWLEAAEE